MNQPYQSPNQPPAPPAAAPGWYADPFDQAEYRYWDGIAWSTEFVRSHPVQLTDRPAMHVASGYSLGAAQATGAVTEYRQLGMPAGVPWMIAGALLTIFRIFYTADNLDSFSQGGAYNTGALVGTALGFLIGGILIGHGYYQYRDWESHPTAKPARRIGLQVMPVALPVACVAFLLAWLVS